MIDNAQDFSTVPFGGDSDDDDAPETVRARWAAAPADPLTDASDTNADATDTPAPAPVPPAPGRARTPS